MSVKPRNPPWLPAEYTYEDVMALKAMAAGKATEHQQVLALKWIVNVAAMAYDEPFFSDSDGGDRNTAYACGKAHVGRQVTKLVNLPGSLLDGLRKKETENGRRRSDSEQG